MIKYIFFFLVPIFSFSQISDKVKKMASSLDTINYAESAHIGFAGIPSKIYNQFSAIDSIATNDELYHYALNGSNALRLYSIESLIYRNDKRITSVFKHYLEQPLFLKYQLGCEIDKVSISEQMIQTISRIKYLFQLKKEQPEIFYNEANSSLSDKIKNWNIEVANATYQSFIQLKTSYLKEKNEQP